MEDTVSKPDNPALEILREEFPGHHIWRSRTSDGRLGEYVATLINPNAGVDATVIRPDLGALRAELMREATRAGGAVRNVR